MESLKKNLLMFFIEYISNQLPDPENKKTVVPIMLRMKRVQQAIFDCMCEIETIITQELPLIKFNKYQKSLTKQSRQPGLLILANDIKNIMNNFENIQSQLTSMERIVNSLDEDLDKTELAGELIISEPVPGKLMTFLASISKKNTLTSSEIEEISHDVWSKHIEVEKMLKAELVHYNHRLNSLETKYFSRISAVKLKSGIKIFKLEQSLRNLSSEITLQGERLKMVLEDNHSTDIERSLREEQFLAKTFEIAHAQEVSLDIKVKNLLAARRILEKNKLSSNNLILQLGTRIEILSTRLSQVQESNSMLIQNNSSLTWCLGRLIDKSNLPEEFKSEIIQDLAAQECQKIEEILKQDEWLELYSIETLSNKFNELKAGVLTLSYAIKNENIKAKLNSLVEESNIERTIHVASLIPIEKKQGLNLARALTERKPKLSPRRKGKLHIPRKNNEKTGDKLQNEAALENLKKIFSEIDENEQEKNKSLLEDLARIEKNEDSFVNSKRNESPGAGFMKDGEPGVDPRKSEEPGKYFLKIESPEASLRRSQETVIDSSRSNGNISDTKRTLGNTETTNILDDSTRKEQVSKIESDLVSTSTQTTSLLSSNFLLKILNPSRQEQNRPNSYRKNAECQTSSEGELEGIIMEIMQVRPVLEDFECQVCIKGGEIYREAAPETEDLLHNDSQDESQDETSLDPLQHLERFGKTSRVTRKIKITDLNTTDSALAHNLPKKLLTPRTDSLLRNYQILGVNLADNLIITKIRSTERIRPEKSPILAENTPIDMRQMTNATIEYHKEFEELAKFLGDIKLTFKQIQELWEEIISRRVNEGNDDKISRYLRSYSGTERFEIEKRRIIHFMTSSTQRKFKEKLLGNVSVTNIKALNNWKRIWKAVMLRSSLNLSGVIEQDDSPLDILFKAAMRIKYVRNRREGKESQKREASLKSVMKKSVTSTLFRNSKWVNNSTSPTVLERSFIKSKFLKINNGSADRIGKSKTPTKIKLKAIPTILPHIQKDNSHKS